MYTHKGVKFRKTNGTEVDLETELNNIGTELGKKLNTTAAPKIQQNGAAKTTVNFKLVGDVLDIVVT